VIQSKDVEIATLMTRINDFGAEKLKLERRIECVNRDMEALTYQRVQEEH
jgi:hypothetical protein